MVRPHASSVDAVNAWGSPTLAPQPDAQPEEEFSAADVAAKESIVQDILSKQEGLKALLHRVTEVQGEANKLKGDNETLQTYIDNLTRNNAMAAGAR